MLIRQCVECIWMDVCLRSLSADVLLLNGFHIIPRNLIYIYYISIAMAVSQQPPHFCCLGAFIRKHTHIYIHIIQRKFKRQHL